MNQTFTPPAVCRICGGTMKAGAVRTTREKYIVPDRYPFEQLTTGELWYELEGMPDGKFVMLNPQDGPLMVLYYRCEKCAS